VTIEMGMRRLARRGLVVALAGIAAMLAGTAAMAQTTGITTHTTLSTGSEEIGGRTVTTYTAKVLGEDGSPAAGVVELVEQGRMLAGAALNTSGEAEIRYSGLTQGYHYLRAVYVGDAKHAASQSDSAQVSAAASASSFSLTLNPTTVTVTAPGDAADVIATVTPASGFTGFVALSCAGPPVSAGSSTDSALPVGVSCTFTPTNLQITSATTPLSSHFTIQTTAPAGGLSQNAGSPLVLAVLLPGVLGLGLLGRKRKALGRVMLVLLVGAIGMAGTSACNARYKYLNHPPTANLGTIPGSYTLTIWAQTSNGVNASETFTTLPLTVK
jgi:hypothetical protein